VDDDEQNCGGQTKKPDPGQVSTRLSIGRVSIEGEIVDSVSGDVLVPFMDSKSGRSFLVGLRPMRNGATLTRHFNPGRRTFASV